MVIEQAILAKNDHLAEHNRAWLAARDIVALNLMSLGVRSASPSMATGA